MNVTIGCPRPEATLKLLAKALRSTTTASWPTATRTEHPEVLLKALKSEQNPTAKPPTTRVRCVPSPFSRILAIEQHVGEEESSKTAFQLPHRQNGFRDSVQAWTTYLRNQGRIPLDYCYPSIPVLIDIAGDDASTTTTTEESALFYGQLKEIAIPDPGGVLLDQLEQTAGVRRVVTGVYGIGGARRCYIRPLPIGVQDHRIPVPTLVFHCPEEETPHNNSDSADDNAWARIGDRGGSSTSGQWMYTPLQEQNMLDIRLCASLRRPQSMFTEAQSSLLAGSLENLQSNRVLDTTTTTKDVKTNQADCWIEIREQAAQRIRKDTAV